ncbi:hypothetical protein EfmJHP35_30320 (plasmid) [Enterococcus faecium]|nr:hypothetical protein EfmJHP35_30320 [Enterococcus faecium]
MNHFKGKQFQQDVIIVAVGYYLRAYAFLKRLVKQFDEPKVVVTDKAPSITSAFKKLKEYGFYQGTEHRTIKYLNNLIEQAKLKENGSNKFYRSLRMV